MIRHVVLLRPVPDLDPAAIDLLHQRLVALTSLIPGFLAVEFGPNSSHEGLDDGYSLGFVCTFANRIARDAYLPHPAHLAVVPLVQRVADHVLVFDLDIE